MDKIEAILKNKEDIFSATLLLLKIIQNKHTKELKLGRKNINTGKLILSL